jgi:hypothetical protein
MYHVSPWNLISFWAFLSHSYPSHVWLCLVQGFQLHLWCACDWMCWLDMNRNRLNITSVGGFVRISVVLDLQWPPYLDIPSVLGNAVAYISLKALNSSSFHSFRCYIMQVPQGCRIILDVCSLRHRRHNPPGPSLCMSPTTVVSIVHINCMCMYIYIFIYLFDFIYVYFIWVCMFKWLDNSHICKWNLSARDFPHPAHQ